MLMLADALCLSSDPTKFSDVIVYKLRPYRDRQQKARNNKIRMGRSMSNRKLQGVKHKKRV